MTLSHDWAYIFLVLDDENGKVMLYGRLMGSNNIKRTQTSVKGMISELGNCTRRAININLVWRLLAKIIMSYFFS